MGFTQTLLIRLGLKKSSDISCSRTNLTTKFFFNDAVLWCCVFAHQTSPRRRFSSRGKPIDPFTGTLTDRPIDHPNDQNVVVIMAHGGLLYLCSFVDSQGSGYVPRDLLCSTPGEDRRGIVLIFIVRCEGDLCLWRAEGGRTW